MRMIHKGTVLNECPLIDKGLARMNGALVQPADPVHPGRQDDTVPVHRRRGDQAVGDVDPDPVTLNAFNRRAVRASVISPGPGVQAGREFVLDLFRDAPTRPGA